jgi:hypothetical protein
VGVIAHDVCVTETATATSNRRQLMFQWVLESEERDRDFVEVLDGVMQFDVLSLGYIAQSLAENA